MPPDNEGLREQTNLRLPPSLKREAKERAEEEGIDFTALVERAIRDYLKRKPRKRQ